MSRPCARGCTIRDVHFAACPDFSGGGSCRGCAPVDAIDHSLICQRCHDRITSALADTPDVLARIRSEADPLKAAVYDREMVSGGKGAHAPAPVSADALDAGDAVMTILWAAHMVMNGREPRGSYTISPNIDSRDAHDMALDYATELIEGLPEMSNTSHILTLAEMTLTMPEDRDDWTIAKALLRWPIEDRSYWATQPCPEADCGLRTVKVFPPKLDSQDTLYKCQGCGWRAPREDTELWAEVFTRKAG